MALFALIVENNELSFTSLYLCPLSKGAAHLQWENNTEALFLKEKFRVVLSLILLCREGDELLLGDGIATK